MARKNSQTGGAGESSEETKAGGTAGSADGETGGSLTSRESEINSPREDFLRNFVEQESSETEEDDGLLDSAEDVNEDGEGDEEEEDTSSEAETGEAGEAETSGESTEEATEDEEEDEEDEFDLGVDLSDIEGLEDEAAQEEIPEDFNPKKDLPKRVWKKLPDEARQAFINHQRLNKRLLREQKENEPLVGYTRELLRNAEQAQVQPRTLNAWIDLGLRAQQGDPAAIEAVGNIAMKGGFQPTGGAAPAQQGPDVEKLRTFLKQKVDDLDLDPQTAKEILKQAQPDGDAQQQQAPAQQQAQQTEPGGRVLRRAPQGVPGGNDGQPSQEAQQAAFKSIEEINQRFQKRFGNKWPDLQKRIRREVVIEQASNPRQDPKAWVKLWADKAKEVVSKHVKRSKSRKRRMQGDSDSLGRGEPVQGRSGGKQEQNPRERFLRQYAG